jgi:hypothetical protein
MDTLEAQPAVMHNNFTSDDGLNHLDSNLDVDDGGLTDFNLSVFGAGDVKYRLDTSVIFDSLGPSIHLPNLSSEGVAPVPPEPMYLRSVSPVSLQWKLPKVLGRRTKDTPSAQMATFMLAQTIASFPYMMTRQENFPPFIHPRSYNYSSDNNELPDILRDCMGLAHMFQTKKRESDRMFWRLVRMEQEKLYAQVCSSL